MKPSNLLTVIFVTYVIVVGLLFHRYRIGADLDKDRPEYMTPASLSSEPVHESDRDLQTGLYYTPPKSGARQAH